jgi:hypothetical protein
MVSQYSNFMSIPQLERKRTLTSSNYKIEQKVFELDEWSYEIKVGKKRGMRNQMEDFIYYIEPFDDTYNKKKILNVLIVDGHNSRPDIL